MNCTYVVTGGYWNIALNPNVDRNDNKWYHPNSCRTIAEWMEQESMMDVWRCQHVDEKRFTWIKTKPNIAWSRIDYFLVSENLMNLDVNTDIIPCILSDHSAIMLEFDNISDARGPGVWKFNNELLKDEQFGCEIKTLIKNIGQVYHYVEPIERWEIAKHEISRFCKEFAKKESCKNKWEKFNLYKTLAAIQDKIVKYGESVTPGTIQSMKIIQKELDSYATQEAKRAAFRCRQNWAKYGELPSKYFFNLEKRNYTRRNMYVGRT